MNVQYKHVRSNIPPLKSVCTAGFHAAKNMFTWRCSYIHYVSLPFYETSLIKLLIKPYMLLFGMLENMTIPTFKTWHCEGEFKMYSYYHLLGNSIHICKIKRSSKGNFTRLHKKKNIYICIIILQRIIYNSKYQMCLPLLSLSNAVLFFFKAD